MIQTAREFKNDDPRQFVFTATAMDSPVDTSLQLSTDTTVYVSVTMFGIFSPYILYIMYTGKAAKQFWAILSVLTTYLAMCKKYSICFYILLLFL